MVYKKIGISEQATSVTLEWLITNTSSQPLIIGDAGLTPFATMDFGSLPIQSPEFIFHSDIISGYTLNLGETIGWASPASFNEPPPPPPILPTYDLSFIALFEFDGDYIPGSGTGNLKFGFGSAYVNVPITFGVVTPTPGQPVLIGGSAGTFSSIPEPATLLLFGLGTLALQRNYRGLRHQQRPNSQFTI
jgi:hypothetical protein